MSKLLYTYTSGGDADKSLAKSNANSYSLIFDEDRKSIFTQGKEFGVTPVNVHANYGKKKTFPAFKAAAESTGEGYIYFLNITRTHTNFTDPWNVHYLLRVTSSDNTNYNGLYDCHIGTSGNTVIYYNYNDFYSTSYRPIYYHLLMHYNTASQFNTYKETNPCKIGARVYSAQGNTISRVFEVTILDYYNCEVDFTENIELYKNIWSTTIYNVNTVMDATAQGLYESGDANSYPNTYNYWYYPTRLAGTLGLTQYTIAVQLHNGTWSSITNKSGGIDKTCLTEGFIPNAIFFYAGATKAAGAWSITTSNTFFPGHYAITPNYFMNLASLSAYYQTAGYDGSVYLVGTIHDDGLFYLDTTQWWAFELPTTENGKYYIYIGKIYSTSAVTLELDNPIYYYYDGRIRQYAMGDDVLRLDDVWGELNA